MDVMEYNECGENEYVSFILLPRSFASFICLDTFTDGRVLSSSWTS